MATSQYPGQKREEAPLPPLPSSSFSHTGYQHHPLSPVMSPEYDPSYRPAGRQSDQTLGSNYDYYGSGAYYDPNHDSDDILLRPNPANGSADVFPHDNHRHEPTAFNSQLPNRDHKPRRSLKTKGFFFGREKTWAVYFFTAVQVAVFIAELVKNGKQRPKIPANETNFSRCPYKYPDSDPTPIQSYDWPFALHSHQYGGALCSLYAGNACLSGHPRNYFPLSELYILRRF